MLRVDMLAALSMEVRVLAVVMTYVAHGHRMQL